MRGKTPVVCVDRYLTGAKQYIIPHPLDIFFAFVYSLICGDHSKEEIPVPIPNTEVKLFYVDDTAHAGK